ncbi:MAG: thioredoxin family protein [Verrucomicrobiota bacterium]
MKPIPLLAISLLLSVSSPADELSWQTDWEAAKAQAAQEQKDLFIHFTGSDWCAWCIKLDEEVFSQETFREYAAEEFILVEVDFPQQIEQSEALKKQNAALKAEYHPPGYPSIFLTNPDGLPYARTGYRPGGPEAYIDYLELLLDWKDMD